MDFTNFSKINSKLTVFTELKCKPQNCNGRGQQIDRQADIPRPPHYSPTPQVQEAVTQGATRKLSSSWLGSMITWRPGLAKPAQVLVMRKTTADCCLQPGRITTKQMDCFSLSDFSLCSPGKLNFQAAMEPISRYVLPLLQVFLLLSAFLRFGRFLHKGLQGSSPCAPIIILQDCNRPPHNHNTLPKKHTLLQSPPGVMCSCAMFGSVCFVIARLKVLACRRHKKKMGVIEHLVSSYVFDGLKSLWGDGPDE